MQDENDELVSFMLGMEVESSTDEDVEATDKEDDDMAIGEDQVRFMDEIRFYCDSEGGIDMIERALDDLEPGSPYDTSDKTRYSMNNMSHEVQKTMVHLIGKMLEKNPDEHPGNTVDFIWDTIAEELADGLTIFPSEVIKIQAHAYKSLRHLMLYHPTLFESLNKSSFATTNDVPSASTNGSQTSQTGASASNNGTTVSLSEAPASRKRKLPSHDEAQEDTAPIATKHNSKFSVTPKDVISAVIEQGIKQTTLGQSEVKLKNVLQMLADLDHELKNGSN